MQQEDFRFELLATDYDGTLTTDSNVDAATWGALERWKADGRRLVLATGRELGELRMVCSRLDLFDRVVAEDGGLLFNPATGEERLLADGPPDALVEALRVAGIRPLAVGRVVVATWEPHGETVARIIQDLGIPRRVARNKRAIMLLPPGVDKASGLRAALLALGADDDPVVGVGDAENDRPLLEACALRVAVANAAPALKAIADRVTIAERGAGVRELVDSLLGRANSL